MRSSPGLREIESLDPVRDHQRIALLVFSQEFPWDAQRSLELALFRTFCVPSVSRLLATTGEFEHRPQKRYDDTEILISEIVEHGYDSPRGRTALRRMNQLHARYEIANGDYLYVLSTFLLEPVRWIDRFGYRPTLQNERIALFEFWRAVGKRMNIRDIPDSYEAFEAFNRAFESQHFVYAESNARVASLSMRLLASWLPWPLGKLVPPSVRALLDERALLAFGLPPAPRVFRASIALALTMRARLLRVLPKRTRPKLRSRVTRRSYRSGYQLEKLGPEP